MARTDQTSQGAFNARDQAKRIRRDSSTPVSLVEPLLDCVAAAELLNVRASWVRDAAREGDLPCVRLGRHVRFTRAMLEEWLVAQLDRPALRRRRVTVTIPGAVARPARVAFRPGTEAALLAGLAEVPKPRKRDE